MIYNTYVSHGHCHCLPRNRCQLSCIIGLFVLLLGGFGLKKAYILRRRGLVHHFFSRLISTSFSSSLQSSLKVFITPKMQLAKIGLLPLLQTFFHFSSSFSPVQAESVTCKATPSDASWPTTSQWASLNRTLSGRLLHPLPPASACHPAYPGSNESCAEIAAAWSTFNFHQNNPVSTAWNNMNNDSCLPDSSAPCSGLGYPVYVVNASSANDVKLAVDFAREHNMRLNVKASGHDYLKR